MLQFFLLRTNTSRRRSNENKFFAKKKKKLHACIYTNGNFKTVVKIWFFFSFESLQLIRIWEILGSLYTFKFTHEMCVYSARIHHFFQFFAYALFSNFIVFGRPKLLSNTSVHTDKLALKSNIFFWNIRQILKDRSNNLGELKIDSGQSIDTKCFMVNLWMEWRKIINQKMCPSWVFSFVDRIGITKWFRKTQTPCVITISYEWRW